MHLRRLTLLSYQLTQLLASTDTPVVIPFPLHPCSLAASKVNCLTTLRPEFSNRRARYSLALWQSSWGKTVAGPSACERARSYCEAVEDVVQHF